jgi:hypothetical protein
MAADIKPRRVIFENIVEAMDKYNTLKAKAGILS